MTKEELQAMIKNVVDEVTAPLLETQRKYANHLTSEGNGQPPTQETTPAAKGENVQPGIRMARAAKLMVLAKNDPERALNFAKGGNAGTSKGMYPDDIQLHTDLKAMSTETPSEGGFLVPEQYANEVIPLLRAKAVVRKLGARSLPMTNGNLNIPKMNQGAVSYYQGENTDAKKSQPKLANLRLSGKKLITLVPISNDLIRNSSYEADALIRDDMLQAMALKEDYMAMYGTGTEFIPRGIMNVKGITSDSLGKLPTSDILGLMIGKLMASNAPMTSNGWIFNGLLWSVLYNLKDGIGNYIHRAEMNQGKLMGLPFAISNQVPVDATANLKTDLFLGDFSEFIIGEEMGLEIMASNEASYNDGTQLVSAFSQDQTVIKVTAKHDFGVRHPEAFIVKNNVFTA